MNRLYAFFGFMAVIVAAFQAGSMFEHDPGDAQLLVDEFLKSIQGIDGLGIFVHNFLLTLPMFLPGFGVVWGIFTGVSTGYVLSAIITLNPEVAISPLELLFLSPFGLMEITAYSLAGSRSFLLIYKIKQKISIKGDAKTVGIEVGIACGLLLAGGYIEYYMIEVARETGMLAF